MPGLEDLFKGNSAAVQLFTWDVISQIVSSLGESMFERLSQKLRADDPIWEISADQAAVADIRNILQSSDAAQRAARQGFDAGEYSVMRRLAMNSPAMGDLLTAWRWGQIPETGTGSDAVTLEQGAAENGVNPKWMDVIKQLGLQRPSPRDILNADLQGQIPDGQDPLAWYEESGGDPTWYQLLFDSNGQSPTPDELLTLANRGIIPWEGTGADVVSYQQGFLEGPWRNKWEPAYTALGQYLPPPRTVTAMLSNGSLTEQQATDLLVKQGLTTDLAAAYVQDAENTQNTTNRALTVSQITALYEDQIVSSDDASNLLQALGYTSDNAQYLLSIVDMQRVINAVNSAVSRIGTLYIGHKIARSTAVSTLTQLGVPTGQTSSIISTWDAEAAANVKTLTESQIVDAWAYKVMTEAQALTELQNIGYTPFDAWVILSNKNQGPLANQPAQGPGTVGTTTTVGTT